MNKPSILVVDDRSEELEKLVAALKTRLGAKAAIDSWQPKAGDSTDQSSDPLVELTNRVTPHTALIVTDFDLTSSGVRGFFGSSIVAWANSKYIPVCNFSRASPDRLPDVSALFEFRLEPSPEATADEVVRIFLGFQRLKAALADIPNVHDLSSPARVLAMAIGREHAESEFAPYFSRVGSANGALVDRLQVAGRDPKAKVSEGDRLELLGYIIGHVLCNAILRYPGPILDGRVLCAYTGHPALESADIEALFADATYVGPFAASSSYFWRSDVDAVLERLDRPAEWDEEAPLDVQNRSLVEAALQRGTAHHDCERCGGVRGGFWCPFTKRPVCERADCSVSSSSWIPDGAWLARVEKDFYDEWAPMLGY